jgi:hypothetical protein
MIRRWGLPWYYVGIGGTAVLIILFVITRIPDNPITGRGDLVNPMGIVVELMEAAFIGLSAAILVLESRMKKLDKRTTTDAA